MTVSITDYGAVPGGNALCTQSIQAAIDAVAAVGGGRVSIPAGLFKSGSIWLKSHVELHLEQGAILRGSDKMEDYNAIDAYPQNSSSPTNEKWLGKHLIIALSQEDIAITGKGTIDGCGDQFFGEPEKDNSGWHSFVWRDGISVAKDLSILRPGQLIAIIECRNVSVTDVTLTNMPCWGLFLHGCAYVRIRGIQVFNPSTYGNSDGIDIDSCQYVTVSDCIIDTGDDAIAIRGSAARLSDPAMVCEFVTISNCVLSSSSSVFRIGVGIGAIRHVRISNITAGRGEVLANFMTGYQGRGHTDIEDVHFVHISAVGLACAMRITESSKTYVRNISFEDVITDSMACLYLCADYPSYVDDITLRNVKIVMKPVKEELTPGVLSNRGQYMLQAKNISNLTIEKLSFYPEKGQRELWKGIRHIEDCPNPKVDIQVIE